MLESKEWHGLPFYMYQLPKTTPGREDTRQSMFTPWNPQMQVPPPVTTHTPLVPNSLARPPHTWSKEEVRVWLEWCAGEFSIDPVSHDKFDMNGKALGLLNRADFMERDPSSGDLLFNALQLLINKHDINPPCAYPSHPLIGPPPGVVNNFTHHLSPCPPLKQPPVHEHRQNGIFLIAGSPTASGGQSPFTHDKHPSSYVPILPGPVTSYPSPIPSKDLSPKIHIPESMLSPAPTTDTDSERETDVLHDVVGVCKEKKFPLRSRSEEDMAFEDGDNHHQHSSEARLSRDLVHDHSLPHVKKNDGDCRLLWEFIHQLLKESKYREYVSWERQEELIFRIVNPTGLAELWGYQKNRTNMTYEKLSRALRYYYKMNIIKKVSGKRLTYQFLQHPRNIKKGQRGARPHSARVAKQESIPVASPQPITDDHHKEASRSPVRDVHPDEDKPCHKSPSISGHQRLSGPQVESFDNYDNQCDLQLINGRLRPPLEDDEPEPEEGHMTFVKPEIPVQDEPEDLSMKTSAVRRNSENADYMGALHSPAQQMKEEQEDERQIKIEATS